MVVFYLFLDAASVMFEASGVAEDMGIQAETGVTTKLTRAVEAIETIQPGGGLGETLFALYVSVTNSLQAFFAGVFAGPVMLHNLGAPTWVLAFLFAPASVYVGIDIIYALTGRDM